MTLEQTGVVVARKQVSRRKLLDAARQLFVERGYHDTRPQDIARAAGVGHGTFYLHFADKRECFLAFVDEAASELHECVVAHTQNATDLAGYIKGIFIGCRDYGLENPGVVPAAMVDATVIGGDHELAGTSIMDRWAHEWINRLEMLREQKLIAPDLDSRVICHAVVGACQQAYSGSLRDGLSDEDVMNSIIPFIVRALKPA